MLIELALTHPCDETIYWSPGTYHSPRSRPRADAVVASTSAPGAGRASARLSSEPRDLPADDGRRPLQLQAS